MGFNETVPDVAVSNMKFELASLTLRTVMLFCCLCSFRVPLNSAVHFVTPLFNECARSSGFVAVGLLRYRIKPASEDVLYMRRPRSEGLGPVPHLTVRLKLNRKLSSRDLQRNRPGGHYPSPDR